MNNASAVDWKIPTAVMSGDTFDVYLKVENTGTTTWYPGHHRMGNLNNLFGPSRIDLARAIPPGNTYKFAFTCKMPSTSARFEYQMLQENVEWFGVKFYADIIAVFKPRLPADDGDIGDLKTAEMFRVHKKIDNKQTLVEWTNDTGTGLFIEGYTAMAGVDKGGICDTSMYVTRMRDKNRIGQLEWDHYADPVAPNHSITQYYPTGRYKYLITGDKLQFISRATTQSSRLNTFSFLHVFSIHFIYE